MSETCCRLSRLLLEAELRTSHKMTWTISSQGLACAHRLKPPYILHCVPCCNLPRINMLAAAARPFLHTERGQWADGGLHFHCTGSVGLKNFPQTRQQNVLHKLLVTSFHFFLSVLRPEFRLTWLHPAAGLFWAPTSSVFLICMTWYDIAASYLSFKAHARSQPSAALWLIEVNCLSWTIGWSRHHQRYPAVSWPHQTPAWPLGLWTWHAWMHLTSRLGLTTNPSQDVRSK